MRGAGQAFEQNVTKETKKPFLALWTIGQSRRDSSHSPVAERSDATGHRTHDRRSRRRRRRSECCTSNGQCCDPFRVGVQRRYSVSAGIAALDPG
jgi:hypothetical protein